MNIKDIKLKNVLYFMQSFVVTAGGKSFSVPRSMIATVDVSKDYDLSLYPLWYVCISVPMWFYTQITKNVDDISVSMNLQYTIGDSTEKLLSSTNPLTTEISGNFKAIIPHTTQIADSSIQKELEKESDAYNRNYTYNQTAMVELALYNTKAYNASFNTLNAVLSSTNLTNAVTYCFNQCGITNVLLSKSDNNKIYSELKIWPQSGISNLLRLVEDYNFHEKGSTLFFDLVDSYLVNNKVGCSAWKNNEYKTTYLVSLSEHNTTMGQFSGIYINNTEKYNLIAFSGLSYKSGNVGSNPVITNTTEQTEMFQIVTEDALMSMLTPNKDFVVNVDTPDNEKYNGRYRLYSINVTLTPSGEYLKPKFVITLRR